MTLRSSLIIFGIWTVVAFAALVFVVTSVAPVANGIYAEAFFFGSLLLATTGIMTILGVLGRLRSSTELPANHLAPAFRQGFLIAVALVTVLLLQRFRILQWWNVLLLGIILVLVDLVFATTKRSVSPGSSGGQ
jgi:hypothetical protein